MRLRNVTDADVFLLWRWQQHPATREYFRVREAPTWAHHARWCADRLNGLCEDLVLWQVLDSRTHGPVGVALVERRERGYELSVVVAPEHRGHGTGTAVIQAATGALWPQTLRAVIHAGNEASVRAFTRAGYLERPAERSGSWLRFYSS